jgi:hypothetical protein
MRSTEGYRRLPCKAYDFLSAAGGTHTLWQGADDLVSVRATAYTESLRRFPLRDIQAVVCTQTRALQVTHAVLAVLGIVYVALISILLASIGFTYTEDILLYLLTVPGLLLLGGVLLSVLRGPTCEVRMITAVQEERVRALGRWRVALRLLPDILRAVEAAQGILEPADAPDALAGRAGLVWQSGRKSVAAVKPPAALARFAEKGWLHLVLFLLILVDIPLCLLHIGSDDALVQLLNGLSGLAIIVTAVACLVVQHGSALSDALKWMAWIVTGVYALFIFATGIAMGVMSAFSPGLFITTTYMDPQTQFYFLSANVLLDAFLGITGLLLLMSYFQSRRASAPNGAES